MAAQGTYCAAALTIFYGKNEVDTGSLGLCSRPMELTGFGTISFLYLRLARSRSHELYDLALSHCCLVSNRRSVESSGSIWYSTRLATHHNRAAVKLDSFGINSTIGAQKSLRS